MLGATPNQRVTTKLQESGQNQPNKDSNVARWTALENVKKSINFGLFTKCDIFSY